MQRTMTPAAMCQRGRGTRALGSSTFRSGPRIAAAGGMRRLATGIGFAFAVALAGAHCGGSSGGLFDGAEAGTGADGSTNQGDSAGGGGGGGADGGGGCASAKPGAACTTAGAVCGSGCNTCVCGSNRSWECASCPPPSCDAAAARCPENVPKDGTTCSLCNVPPECDYPCTGGASSPTYATCTGGSWQVRTTLGACVVCSPACTDGRICCLEPTHRTTEAGTPEALPTCVLPLASGACPALP
jgi:hypothetical protein